MLLPVIMADVIANILPQVLLMADVIAKMSICIVTTNVDMLYGRCYCQVADGMAITGLECWQMLLPSGRWNSHWVLLF